MHITRECLHNFGPFRHFETSFVRGLVGIMGANGSGKSTLANAAYAALSNDFGRFPGVKVDNICDLSGKKEESFVEIDAIHEGMTFTLRRSLRPKRHSLKIVGEEEITKDELIDARLRHDLGVDMKLISSYAFIGQWQLNALLSMTPAIRAEAFKHLCRTHKASAIYAACGKFLEQVTEVVLDNSAELLAEIGELETRQEKLNKRRRRQAKLLLNEKSKASAEKLLRKAERHKDLLADIPALEVTITEQQSTYTVKEAKHKRLVKRLKDRRAGEAKLQPKVEAAQTALKHWEQYEKRRKRKIQLQAELMETEQREKPEPTKPDDCDSLGRYRTFVSNAESEKKQAEGVIRLYETSRGGHCPTCQQPIDEAFVQRMRKQLQTADNVLAKLKPKVKRIEDYQADLGNWKVTEASRQTYRKSLLDELATLAELHEPEGDDKESLEGIVRRAAERAAAITDESERVELLNNRLSHMSGILSQQRERLEKLRKQLTDTVVEASLLSRAQQRLAEHAAATLAIAEIDGSLQELESGVASRKLALDQLRAQLRRQKKLVAARQTFERIRDVFHWSALPHRVARGNLVRMEDDLNDTLSWFGSPFWTEAAAPDEEGKAELGFMVHFPGAPPRKFERLSGGQGGVFAIAFHRAAQKIFDADIGTMWLDEPTAALDAQNLEFFGEALQRLAAEVRGQRQLVIVTHAQDTLWSAFDQVIEVKS